MFMDIDAVFFNWIKTLRLCGSVSQKNLGKIKDVKIIFFVRKLLKK